MAASAAVVAVCVATLTVTALVSGLPLSVHHKRTFDSEYSTTPVDGVLRDRDAIDDLDAVTCPAGLTVSTRYVFECTVVGVGPRRSVTVTITDADTGAIEVSDPVG